MRFIFKQLIVFVLSLVIFSCSNDTNDTITQTTPDQSLDTSEENDSNTNSEETNNENNTSEPKPDNENNTSEPKPDVDTPSNQNTSFTDKVDRAFFKQIRGFADIYDQKEIIEDFAFSQYPMYFIQTKGGGFFETGNPVKGFVINPISEIEGAQKLGDNESFGLNIYRFDNLMEKATNKLKAGNGLYSNFVINRVDNYYLQKYSEGSVIGLNETSDITTASHEAFHILYQTQGPQNPNWKFLFNGIQDQENFPFTKEVVELQILISEIFKEFPNINDKEIIKQKIKQYIAIRSKEIEIDPSSRKLIKNMSLNQERIEGGAYYVETMAKRAFFKLKDPFWEITYGVPIKAKSKEKLKEMLSFGFFYESGASIMYGINILDKSKMFEYNSKTPFDIVSSMFPMTSLEKANALEAAKASVDWALIQEKASEFTK